jgi:selenocysteine-specific elongation factor
MKRIILGTAGHIDHGKTELIRALTGIETDRLKEEKQRGISIELGFAYLEGDDDLLVGIVDVPGHERFVRQMVAGSGGVDIAALVIALDEGVMPQTLEHLDILTLLGIQRGLVVLTKLDLVDDELAMLAEEDAREAVAGTFLESAPFIRVSSRSGEGIDELRGAIFNIAREVTARPVHGLLRLPVDRVFTIKGHGTVVTGTLISGTIRVGDSVAILPTGKTSSVRSLQSHSRQETEATPGERVAVNLRGIEQHDIERGAVLTHPDELQPSHIIDVDLRLLIRAPFELKNRRKVRLHHYTTEVEARVVFADRETLSPGDSVSCQLRTTEPIVPASGDRFVIRSVSPSLTLGGGTIVNPRGAKLRARTAKHFEPLDVDNPEEILAALLRASGISGYKKSELLGLSGLSAKQLDKALDRLSNARTAVRIDPAEQRYVHGDAIDLVKNKMRVSLKAFHKSQPLKEGISRQELRSSVPGSEKLFKKALDALASAGEVADEGTTVRLASHEVRLKEDEQGLKDRLLTAIQDGRNTPPTLKEMTAVGPGDVKQVRSMLGILEKEGRIVKVKEDLYFAADVIEEIKRSLVNVVNRDGGITPSQFNEITKASRKFNIPLLEYFDRIRFTIRVGDQRVLRGSGFSEDGGNAS